MTKLTKIEKAKFFALDEEEFINLCRLWNKKNVDIDLSKVKAKGYDDWLNYFKTITPSKGKFLVRYGKDSMDIEAYSALSRWYEIIANPNKIDKLYKAQLNKQVEQDIMAVAIGDDDEKFYISLIQQNVHQLQSSSVSQQEVARLTSNINIFRKELRLIRSRSIGKNTTLAKILEEANKPRKPKKPPSKAKVPPKPKPKVTKKKDAKTNVRKPNTKN